MRKTKRPVLTLITVTFAIALLGSCRSLQAPTEPSATYPPVMMLPTSTKPPSRPEKTATLLDLREANILDVVYTPLPDGNYRFDVTLVHDDLGEAPSFADRWVLEDLDGNLLGERILLHAHGNEPFTRSATIFIPESIHVVVVRGHDALHGFGGQAFRLDLRDGIKEPLTDSQGE